MRDTRHLLKIWLFALVVIASNAIASPIGTVRISPYPSVVMADGKSIVNISVDARDQGGHAVPNGTQVTLTTTLGQFRESIVSCTSGVARAVLVSGTISGNAKITASVMGLITIGTAEVEFVNDRRAISAASEYIEVGGRDYLAYFPEPRWVSASGKNKEAFIIYRDIEIRADDMQLDAGNERVIARNAVVKSLGKTLECVELSYQLRARQGIAVTNYEGRTQLVTIRGTNITGKPEYFNANDFHMRDDLDTVQSFITAHYITIFPNNKVQFHRANIYVGGAKVMSLPLYSFDMWSASGQFFSTNLIGFQDGRLSLELPFYYMLSPKGTGALTLRTRQQAGRGYSSSHGTFLDLDQSYSSSDKYDGAFSLTNLASGDWGASFRHNQRFGENMQGFFMADFPEHKGSFFSASLNRQFKGFHAGLSASMQNQFSGIDPDAKQFDFSLETDPRRIKGTPFNNTWALTSSYTRMKGYDGKEFAEDGVGLRWRGMMNPIRFSKTGSLQSGLTVSKLFGTNATKDVDVLATISSTMRLFNTTSFNIVYDFAHDSMRSAIMGSHRLSAQIYSTAGPVRLSLIGISGLDTDYNSILTDASFQISPLLRFGASYTYQKFVGFGVDDFSLVLGYRIGFRELALTWSKEAKRINIELLSASF
jgi:hypothetical protein